LLFSLQIPYKYKKTLDPEDGIIVISALEATVASFTAITPLPIALDSDARYFNVACLD